MALIISERLLDCDGYVILLHLPQAWVFITVYLFVPRDYELCWGFRFIRTRLCRSQGLLPKIILDRTYEMGPLSLEFCSELQLFKKESLKQKEISRVRQNKLQVLFRIRRFYHISWTWVSLWEIWYSAGLNPPNPSLQIMLRSTANQIQRIIAHEERRWTAFPVKVGTTKTISFQLLSPPVAGQ